MLEIFQYDFMVRAFVAGVVTAIVAPLIGMFLVVRRYSLMADTLAHVSLVGVAVGVISGLHPGISALVAAIVAALGIERLRQTGKFFSESVLALFLSGGLAVAVLLLSFAHGLNVNLFSFLFGSIATVSSADLISILGVGAVIVVTVALLYKEFFFISFNEELAEANGMSTRLLNNILIILAAVAVALSMRIIGVLLIGALMVVPVVSAMLYELSFLKTLFLSIGFALLSVILGLFASYYLDIPSGSTIVVLALVFFVLTTIITRAVSFSARPS